MKRLVRFLALFGFGLLALVLALGPGRLFRRTVEPTIAPTDLGSLRAPIQVGDPAQPGRGVGVALEGAGRIPNWKTIVAPDGSTRRVMDALVEYPNPGIEAFAGGFHVTQPVITLFPGEKADEKPTARIRAGGADVATRGDASQSLQLASGSQSGRLTDDVREFTLAPAVVIELLDANGAVEATIETARLEAPEAPDPKLFASRFISPGEVHYFRADGTFDLRAGGMELDRAGGRVTFRPPLAITGTELSLPGLTAQKAAAPGDAARSDAEPVRPARPPFFLTAEGPATFVRKAAAAASGTGGALNLQGVVGPGELVFTKNVYVKQADENQQEQWLRTDRAVLELGEDATGKLIATRFDAGVANAPLALGILGGTGNAAALHWNPIDGGFVLDGPIDARDLVIGEGATAKKLGLKAAGRLIARELPADATLPARREIELLQAAHVEISDELVADAERLVADADRLVALLVPPAEGEAGGAKLLAVDLFGREPDAAGAGKVPATADLGTRGRARAQTRIHLIDDGAGGHIAHLEGDARVDTDRGFLAGEKIDIVAPSEKIVAPAVEKAPTRVTVPVLAAGEFALPDDAGLFGPGGMGGSGGPGASSAGGAENPPRRLVLEPLGPCKLTSDGDALTVLGRCIYHVRARAADAPEGPDTTDLQTLTCNELYLLPGPKRADGREEFDVRAVGDVVLDSHDPESPLHLLADFAYTESAAGGARRLVLGGTPARMTIALPTKSLPGNEPRNESGNAVAPARGEIDVTASHIVRDLVTEALVAEDERDQVRVLVPEALLASLLPSVRSTVASTRFAGATGAEDAPAELRADHFSVTPKSGLATPNERLLNGRFDAHGRVRITRPSTLGTVTCQDLALDLARRFARLDGEEAAPGGSGVPVVIEQPLVNARDRLESVTAAWIEARDGGREVDVAPNAIFVLYPETKSAKPERAPESGEKPKFTRVEIHASDAPSLAGPRLSFTGGVEIFLTMDDAGGGEPKQAHARSERAELIFNHGLDQPGAELLMLNASQRVHLDYGTLRGEGARLSYDFKTEWMELKEGAQPCTLFGQDEKGEWHATSHFRRMLMKGPPSQWPSGEMILEGLELVVEGPRAR